MSDSPLPPPKSRPFTLKAVCLLLMLRGLFYGLLAVLLVLGRINLDEVGFLENLDSLGALVWAGTLAVLSLVMSVGLWQMRPWAWRLTMIAMGVILVVSMWSQFNGNATLSNATGLVINIFIVFYLVQNEIRVLFAEDIVSQEQA